jgi:hypothetical protein
MNKSNADIFILTEIEPQYDYYYENTELSFNHPVKEIHWSVQNDSKIEDILDQYYVYSALAAMDGLKYSN